MSTQSRSDRSLAADRACTICGGAMSGAAAGTIDGACCCESCYLDRCTDKGGAFDQAYGSFAEALTAALDLREHETGLHSKRVACHTLVLARHFITDPAPLRQVYWGALLHDVGKMAYPTRFCSSMGRSTKQTGR